MKLWLQAPEVMVHFIFPFISSISLLAGFHSLNRMPLVSEMVHTGGLSFAVQRKIDQLPNMPVHLLNQNRVATVLLISVLANRVVLAEKSFEHGAHL